MKSEAEIWASTAQNVVIIVVLGAGWLLGKADAIAVIPALLLCAGVDIRNRLRGKSAADAAPPAILAAAIAASQLL